MFPEWSLIVFFIIELVALYFISRISINELFRILRRFIGSEKIVFSIISLIFLPGTILHELSHFFMAIFVFLRVRDITIFPEWEGNYIKLGSVVYEKKDVFRSILVGIAPVIIGLLFFGVLSQFGILPQNFNLGMQILLIYGIFVVSTTMFSSKQDLVDIVYIIPLFLVIGAALFIFDIDVIGYVSRNQELVANIRNFLYAINGYLLISIGIHIVLISSSRLFFYILKRR